MDCDADVYIYKLNDMDACDLIKLHENIQFVLII